MNHLSQTTQRVALETVIHKLRLPVVVAIVEAMTVCHVELLAADFHGASLAVQDDAAFLLQVFFAPHVVVALKIMHFDAEVGQFAHLAQKAREALRHDIFILKPKVEHVSQHEDSLGFVLDGVQKTDQTPLLCAVMLEGTAAQVGIGYEIIVLHRQK